LRKSNTTPIQVEAQLPDIDHFNEAARAWDIAFRQLSRGASEKPLAAPG
jgi:hypothetical protein